MTESTRMLLRSAAFLALMVVIGVAGMAVFALVERELHPAVATGPAAAGDKAAAALRQDPTRPHRICQSSTPAKTRRDPCRNGPTGTKCPHGRPPHAALGQIPLKSIYSQRLRHVRSEAFSRKDTALLSLSVTSFGITAEATLAPPRRASAYATTGHCISEEIYFQNFKTRIPALHSINKPNAVLARIYHRNGLPCPYASWRSACLCNRAPW